MLVCQFFCVSYITNKAPADKLVVLDIEITFALMVKHNATVRKGLERVHFALFGLFRAMIVFMAITSSECRMMAYGANYALGFCVRNNLCPNLLI